MPVEVLNPGLLGQRVPPPLDRGDGGKRCLVASPGEDERSLYRAGQPPQLLDYLIIHRDVPSFTMLATRDGEHTSVEVHIDPLYLDLLPPPHPGVNCHYDLVPV